LQAGRTPALAVAIANFCLPDLMGNAAMNWLLARQDTIQKKPILRLSSGFSDDRVACKSADLDCRRRVTDMRCYAALIRGSSCGPCEPALVPQAPGVSPGFGFLSTAGSA
jgi:hypothetical protein